jgi:predicted SAM-dependent methyltransferase
MTSERLIPDLPAQRRPSPQGLLFRIPGLRFIASAFQSAFAKDSMLRHSAHVARNFARSCTGPYHVLSREVRRTGYRRRQRSLIDAYLAAPGPKKLQIGCGKALLDGWLNTDIRQDIPGVCYLDASIRFPIPDRQIDFIFTEHVIEHLPYAAGASMLRESFRVLKPGGKIRIATPDLKKILALYNAQPTPEQQKYIRWSVDTHLGEIGIYTPQFVINNFFASWGHRFIYDVPTLSALLKSIGFTEVTEHSPGQSDEPALGNIESHGREIGDEMNRMETMVLEARKPA